jgi:hypothetical protein
MKGIAIFMSFLNGLIGLSIVWQRVGARPADTELRDTFIEITTVSIKALSAKELTHSSWLVKLKASVLEIETPKHTLRISPIMGSVEGSLVGEIVAKTIF